MKDNVVGILDQIRLQLSSKRPAEISLEPKVSQELRHASIYISLTVALPPSHFDIIYLPLA